MIGGTSSEFSVKDGNLVNEHLDDSIKNDVFFISSGFFGHIVSSDDFSFGDRVIKSLGRFEIDFPKSVFVIFSTNKVDNEFIN